MAVQEGGPRTGQDAGDRSGDLGWYPWVAMGVVLSGTYLTILNMTVLGVALPSIADDLAGGDLEVDWVITSFLVAVVVVQPATGWLVDRFGRKAVWTASLVLFGVGSLLCAVAPTLPFLVGARVVQGLGGGSMAPVGMAMIYELFPPDRRGTALGIYGVAMMAGPALGPPIGGWIVTNWSWRVVFSAFVPIAALAVVLSLRLIRDLGGRIPRPFDLGGWVLAGTGVVLVVLGSRQAAEWGFGAPRTLAVLGAGVALLVVLVVRSLRRPDPIIEFRMFATPTFAMAMAVSWWLTIVQFARLNFLPVELQVVRGLTAQEVGLLVAPGAIGVALTMPLGGWLADRVGSRPPVLAGLVVMAGALWELAHLRPTTSEAAVVAILLAQGLGVGLAMMPSTVAAMNALPSRFVGQAAAVRSLNQQLGNAVGTAALAAYLVARLGAVAPSDVDTAAEVVAAQDAYNDLFMLTFACLLATIVLALGLPGRRRMAAMQAERAVEHEEFLQTNATSARR